MTLIGGSYGKNLIGTVEVDFNKPKFAYLICLHDSVRAFHHLTPSLRYSLKHVRIERLAFLVKSPIRLLGPRMADQCRAHVPRTETLEPSHCD